MNLLYAGITAKQFGKTDDSGVILFWSGIYILLSWIFFIWIPTKLIPKLKYGKAIYFATPIMGLYSAIAYTILLGKIFDFGETYIFFLPYAILTGLIYGLLFTIIKVSPTSEKYLLFLTPSIGIAFYLLFPLILPSQAYRFMPDRTQDKIVSKIIPQLKEGESYKLYLEKLPNAFKTPKGLRNAFVWVSSKEEIPEDYNTSMSASNEFISFNMQVENGIITKLEYKLRE